MQTAPLLRTVEECSLNAWPGLREVLLDGWLLRFGAGLTRRANAVHALYDAGDLPAKLARCEAVYAAHGQPCVFKITPFAPPALDGLLERAGYRREGETRVLLLDALPAGADDPHCALVDPREAPWRDTFARLDEMPARRHEALRDILARVVPPQAGALLCADGAVHGAAHGAADGAVGHSVVSCGRAVQEQDWVGLFEIATDPAQRRHGYGARVVARLLAWGRGQGARRAYLQVEADNVSAGALYERFGFREQYRYGYRVK